ncbi:MAG: nicotinamide mononucleotide transporter [Clostridia bacterium]|nr:nicotinamide mononucleotide transporter [Clostridia bacterium]
MKQIKTIFCYFSKTEWLLWSVSTAAILASFLLFDRGSYLTLSASLIGVTSLIFCAKGNPIGQILMIAFGVLYGIISFEMAYYGEMLTYLGMTVPMAIFALVSWLRNPYKGNRAEVRVNTLRPFEYLFMLVLTALVTVAFYFILRALGTASLIPSTLSVTTSFAAVYLTFRRSELFALIYAANDVVLLVLWVMASLTDTSYISVVTCFAVFLVNDIYGYINWSKMKKRQNRG